MYVVSGDGALYSCGSDVAVSPLSFTVCIILARIVVQRINKSVSVSGDSKVNKHAGA